MQRRRLVSTLILSLAFAGAAAAYSPASRATDAAFAALLSMPTAAPESGAWVFPPAPAFKPGSEARLIAYLGRQKKAGADVNAYRHQGTLLHHAIRANLVQTAAWLAANGADPRLKVRGSDNDALSLARGNGQAALVTLFMQQHRMAVPAPPRLAPPPPPEPEVRDPARECLHFAETAPPETWAAMIARGYPARAEDALGCRLNDATLAQLQTLWPRLTAHFPDVRVAAPRMLLSGFRARSERTCSPQEGKQLAAKLAFLADQGVRESVAGISKEALDSAAPDLRAAIAPWVKAPAARAHRLQAVAPACSFVMDGAWRTALAGKPGWKVVTVQPLEVPGEGECAVLAGGSSQEYFPSGLLTDEFTGPIRETMPLCADPTDVYQVWRRVNGKFVVTATSLGRDDTLDQLALVRDSVTGRRYYLNSGRQAGRCHAQGRMPFAFEWRGGQLVRSFPGELENVLHEQCNWASGEIACPGIPDLLGARERPEGIAQVHDQVRFEAAPAAPARAAPSDAEAASQRKAYLAAILALDKPALRAIEAKGIVDGLTASAIEAVSASQLPLADKRKRIAWLFYNRERLAGAVGHTGMLSLLNWLPDEDWRPVMKAIAMLGPTSFEAVSDLRQAAADQGMPGLACDIDNARGWMCGETMTE